MMMAASRAKCLLVVGLVMLVLLTGTSYSQYPMVDDMRLVDRPSISTEPLIYSGGTVEQIEVTEYATLSDALSAVNDGAADLFGQMIPVSEYATVDSYSNLKKQWAYDSSGVVLAMNYSSYPLNNEHLRRAIAFAIDKNNITEHFPQPVDTVDFLMPLNYPQSLESSEGGTFYSADVVNASSELVQAGMIDVDEDGFVEAPNGADFVFTVLVPSDVGGMNMTASTIVNNLLSIGLNATLSYSNSTSIQSQIANHTLDYQIALYTIDYPSHSPGWGITTFMSSMASIYGENVANFSDDEYDAAITDYVRNYNPVERESLMRDGFRLLRDKAPVIPLFFYRWLSVYTEANFAGWIDDTNAGAYSVWNPVSVHATGASNTLKVAVLPDFFDTFFTSLNPFKTGHVLDDSWVWKEQFNPYMLVYDSPLATLANGSRVSREAASWQILLPGMVAGLGNNETQAVFFSDPIANFTDGTFISGQDYRFTMDLLANHSLLPYDLDYVESTVIGDYQVRITVKGIHPYLYNVFGQMPILPRHLWANRSISTWDPTIADAIGSGPYKFQSFTPGSKLVLTINSGYYPIPDTEAPELLSLKLSPEDPIPAVSVTFQVYIYDRSKVAGVLLSYTYDSGTLNFTESIPMEETSTGFTATIPQHLTATFVNYSIRATDAWGNSAIIATGHYDMSTTSEAPSLFEQPLILGTGAVIVLVVIGVAIKRRG